MAGTIIHDSPHLRVIANIIADGPVFVTFNEMGFLVSGDHYWGDAFFQQRNLSSIGIVTPRPNWYPPDDMNRAALAIRESSKDRRLITYGLSQGAYGALKYARAVGADTALAFCPQWSIDPADVTDFDRRFERHYVPKLANGSRIEADEIAPHSYIFYDPLTVNDRMHADRLLRYEGAVGIKCPFTGHVSLRQLTDVGLIAELIAAVAQTSTIPAAQLRALFRRSRAKSGTYQLGRVEALVARRRFSLARRSLNGASPEFALYIEFVLALEGAADTQPADVLEKLTDADIAKIGVNRVWERSRMREFLEGELRAARLMRTMLRSYRSSRFRVIDTFMRADLLDYARRELDAVIEDFGPHEEAERIADLKARLAHGAAPHHLSGEAK